MKIPNERLSDAPIVFFEANGDLMDLPSVFDPTEVQQMNIGLEELLNLIHPGEDSKEIRK